MGITFTVTAATAPDVESGLYDADFLGVEEGPTTQYGPTLRWNFDAYVDGEAERVTALTSTSTSSKSTGYKFMTAILGRQPEVGENIDFDSLVGKRCRVLVEDNAKGWPTVTDVKPSKKAAA